MPAGRRRTWVAVAAGTALTAVVGCAPQSPDQSSWRDQAHLSLEDVASNVATDSLLVKLARQGRMFGKYQQIVALNMETNAGTTAGHLSAEQPDPADDPLYHQVTSALSDATDLLSEVRIALVRRDSGRYAALAQQLDKMTTTLAKTASAVRRAGS